MSDTRTVTVERPAPSETTGQQTPPDAHPPAPDGVPPPEELPVFEWGRGIDLRFVPPEGKGVPRQRLWMRADGALPDLFGSV